MILPTDFAWRTFFGGWSEHRYPIDSCFEQGWKWYIHDSLQVTTRLRESGSCLEHYFIFWEFHIRLSSCFRVRKCGTHFEQMRVIFKLFFRICYTVVFKISSNDAILRWLTEQSLAINAAKMFFIISVNADTSLPLDGSGTAAVLPTLKCAYQSLTVCLPIVSSL